MCHKHFYYFSGLNHKICSLLHFYYIHFIFLFYPLLYREKKDDGSAKFPDGRGSYRAGKPGPSFLHLQYNLHPSGQDVINASLRSLKCDV